MEQCSGDNDNAQGQGWSVAVFDIRSGEEKLTCNELVYLCLWRASVFVQGHTDTCLYTHVYDKSSLLYHVPLSFQQTAFSGSARLEHKLLVCK